MLEHHGYSARFAAFAADFAAAAIQRQEALQAFLPQGAWEVDLDARTLVLGNERLYGVTLLGTFAHSDRTWLWGWANPGFGWDEPAVAPLRGMYAYGRRQNIPELTTGVLDFSSFPEPLRAAGALAILAAVPLGGCGVHAVEVNDGAGQCFLHLDDPRGPKPGLDPVTAPRLIMSAIEAFPDDHRRVVRGFLTHHGAELDESSGQILTRVPEGLLIADFDDRNRLTNLSFKGDRGEW
ncbi:MAG: hypothetical protein GEV11_26305 [Streptosporangiales bacterium]|nr:hypothetical protein [Streptosporangiales bacterium]